MSLSMMMMATANGRKRWNDLDDSGTMLLDGARLTGAFITRRVFFSNSCHVISLAPFLFFHSSVAAAEFWSATAPAPESLFHNVKAFVDTA